MESLAAWFAAHLGQYISAKAVVFIVSLMPILECRGGLIVASLLGVDIVEAIPICVIGNFLPIPFILLFIKRIFKWLKKFGPTERLVTKLENRAMNKSDALEKGEFLGLMLFKKALVAEILGILIATVIMSIVSYGLLARVV